jgi:hypothetical protein
MKIILALICAVALCGCGTFNHSPVPANHWSGSIDGQPFNFDLPKQTVAEDIEIESVRGTPFGTNYSRIKIGKIGGTNSPDVIDAAAQLETARWNGINSAIEKIGGIASSVAEKTAKGAVEGVK